MKNVGVVLSGCGVQDGAEIHEAVATLLALARNRARAVCLAPDLEQTRVVDHSTGEEAEHKRNMLVEGARIARGEITALAEADPGPLDAVIIPGGFGAALNLTNFATAGAKMEIEASLEKLLNAMCDADKPLAALCIAPPILARLMQKRGVAHARITVGNDPGVAQAIRTMGQKHVDSVPTEAVVDEDNKLVTCAAYMLAPDIAALYEGIERAVVELLKLA